MSGRKREGYLRLKPGLGIGRDRRGLLYATHFVTGKTRVYEGPAWVEHLLAASTRGIPEEKALEFLGEDAEVSPEELEGILDYLLHEGIVLRLTLEEVARINLGRYGRQIECFYEFAGDRAPFAFQDRLAASSVVLLGLGGIGSWMALLLAMAGVGALTLVDGGTVKESNLSRQPLYREGQLGLRKVEAARASLLALNSGMRVSAYHTLVSGPEDLREIVPGHDLVINAMDDPDINTTSSWVAEVAEGEGIPYLLAGGYSGHIGRIGPTVLPGKTPDWNAFQQYYAERRRENPDVRFAVGRENHKAAFAPLSALVSALQVWDAIRVLTRLGDPLLAGRLGEVDFATGEVRWEPVPAPADA